MATKKQHPGFHLPPFKVEMVVTALSQTVDWGLTALGVPEAWKKSKGSGVRVAVLDTGYDATHPDLASQVVESADFTGSPVGVQDLNGHGTHVAGTVAAVDNGIGVIGVAPKAELVIGKVLGDNGSGSDAGIARGIRWAIDKGANIISMSLGSSAPSPSMLSAIREAVKRNVFVVVAAGNEGPGPNTVGYPGRYPESIAVAAVGKSLEVTRFSSRGPEVCVAAPGDKILSCWPGGRYSAISGTSMATPFVSGVVALMLAANPGKVKSQSDLKKLLAETAKDRGPDGHDSAYGWGLVDPSKLVGETEHPGGNPWDGVTVIWPTGESLRLVRQ